MSERSCEKHTSGGLILRHGHYISVWHIARNQH